MGGCNFRRDGGWSWPRNHAKGKKHKIRTRKGGFGFGDFAQEGEWGRKIVADRIVDPAGGPKWMQGEWPKSYLKRRKPVGL